jgi:O-acetyl-ADP-ribose deacetylase (regulator of RNase III)
VIVWKKGNLLESDCDYICHQVNCTGAMNSGIAKQIREKWPIVYKNYIAKCSQSKYIRPELLLGDIQIVGLWDDYNKTKFHQSVINMYSQLNYGYDGKRYTSYDAFWNCLNLIKQSVPIDKKIGFPYNIGCGLGGANWAVILAMIDIVFSDYTVEIYVLEG